MAASYVDVDSHIPHVMAASYVDDPMLWPAPHLLSMEKE